MTETNDAKTALDPITERIERVEDRLDGMESILRAVADTALWRRLIVDNAQLFDNLTATQARCTNLEEEARALRRELDVANLTIHRMRAAERAAVERVLDGEVDP